MSCKNTFICEDLKTLLFSYCSTDLSQIRYRLQLFKELQHSRELDRLSSTIFQFWVNPRLMDNQRDPMSAHTWVILHTLELQFSTEFRVIKGPATGCEIVGLIDRKFGLLVSFSSLGRLFIITLTSVNSIPKWSVLFHAQTLRRRFSVIQSLCGRFA